jgi:hypothetical protein
MLGDQRSRLSGNLHKTNQPDGRDKERNGADIEEDDGSDNQPDVVWI